MLIAKKKYWWVKNTVNYIFKYDMTNIYNLTLDSNNYVSKCNDTSGNSYDLIQNTQFRKPLYINNSLYFNGNNFLNVDFGRTIPQPITYFIKWRASAVLTDSMIFDGINSTYRNGLLFYQGLHGYAGYYSVPSPYQLTTPFSVQIISCIVINGSYSKLYENGILKSSNPVGEKYTQGITLGAYYNYYSFFTGYISKFYATVGVLDEAIIKTISDSM